MSKESEYHVKWAAEAAKPKFKAMSIRERIAAASAQVELSHRLAANAERAEASASQPRQSMRDFAQSRSEAAE